MTHSERKKLRTTPFSRRPPKAVAFMAVLAILFAGGPATPISQADA
ncbi:hypothetical protein [Paeniglutamicibacter kerguelensis]|uniref:Uncharacterized protein n=1 Tax=Paeniglutamicibacter kerguelensis TaxID=254788 RepID=A0ABS4X894_9MICC|nr:hypothetical protein [Paeniglutamicibacter kerguelensis]MBP2384695.1 hypothetical protein [Paeniglutamicibacter kerguelensis]